MYGNNGFYFPDDVNVNAKAESNAYSNGRGNSQANANSNALATSNLNNDGSRYPEFYKPSGHGYEVQG